MQTSFRGVLTYLRRLAPQGADEDGALLARFAEGDAPAFTTLVGKYAPLVWGVCRRLLGPSPDAEDAFQATFVVLVRKASSLDRAAPIGPWLHKVASRTALKARARTLKRQARETQVDVEPTTSDPPTACQRELGVILEEELSRLPEHYRRPVVLCYLEGLTNEEAARRLDCPKGTILSRLSRAREQLRERLSRRGFDLPAVLAAEPAPAALMAVVAEAGPALHAGAVSGLSTSAMILAKGVVSGMLLRKLEVAGVAMLAVALMASGAGWLMHRPGGGAVQAAGPDEQKTPAKKTEAKGKAEAEMPKGQRFLELGDALNKTIEFHGIDDPKTTLTDALDQFARFHRLTFDLNEKAVKAAAPKVDVGGSRIAEVPLIPMKASLRTVLEKILSRVDVPSGLTYLVRKDHIEITTAAAARAELHLTDDQPLVLVHADFRDTDFGEAMRKIIDDTEISVVFDPRVAKEAANARVTARLMNVPVETALKLLADAAGLCVVKQNNVYYVTSEKNAAKLQSGGV